MDSTAWSPIILDNDRLDLAVARGAAYYGMVRRGEGVRIAANLARSYYIGVESDQPTAVCLVPGSAEPGQTIEMPDRLFRLLISEPVEFPLWVSSLRLTDPPGALVAIDREQMSPLPPIRTVLRTHRRRETGTISVRLHARLTEIGTMDLWCTAADRDRSWRSAVRHPFGHRNRRRRASLGCGSRRIHGRSDVGSLPAVPGERLCAAGKRPSGGPGQTTVRGAGEPQAAVADSPAAAHLGNADGIGVRTPQDASNTRRGG